MNIKSLLIFYLGSYCICVQSVFAFKYIDNNLQTLEDDSLILVSFYNSTNGNEWGNNTNWLTGPVSTWHGVEVENERVVSLNMYQNNLSGFLPESIGDLRELTFLHLGFNNISGVLPNSIGNLDQLTGLWFHDNNLSGSIPEEIGDMDSLHTIWGWSNNISGTLPETISNLTSLESLLLYNNSLEGELPTGIYDLSNLQSLNLSNNSFIGGLTSDLANLSTLTYLSLSGNLFDGEIPVEIGELTGLTFLSLAANRFSGEIPAVIGNLENLRQLFLGYNELSGEIPIEIGQLTKLTDLTLGNNNLAGEIPSSLGDLQMLNTLSMEFNQLSGPVPESFRNLNNLSRLDLHWNLLTSLPDLSELPLESLLVHHNFFGFDSLEPNYSKLTLPLEQNDFGESRELNVFEDETIKLSFGPISGSQNIYQWFKFNSPVQGEMDSIYLIQNVKFSDEGSYRLTVTSPTIPDLVLESLPITITVSPKPLSAIQTSGSKINLFPNPANDVIMINFSGLSNELQYDDMIIYNSIGQEQTILNMISLDNAKIRVGLSSLSPGFYVLQIPDVKGRFYQVNFIKN